MKYLLWVRTIRLLSFINSNYLIDYWEHSKFDMTLASLQSTIWINPLLSPTYNISPISFSKFKQQ